MNFLQANLQMVETLTAAYAPVDFCLLEAGGDNLSANFSRELADYIIYVVSRDSSCRMTSETPTRKRVSDLSCLLRLFFFRSTSPVVTRSLARAVRVSRRRIFS